MATVVNRPTDILLNRDVSEVFSETGDGVKVPSTRPTPLIGTWADESWPLNSRQASEAIIAEVQRQRSSIIFEDDDGNVVMEDSDSATENEQHEDDVDEIHTQAVSELNEALSIAHPSQDEVGNDITTANSSLSSPLHVSRCYTYDPYNVTEGYCLRYCCYCETCIARGNTTTSPPLERHDHTMVYEDVEPQFTEPMPFEEPMAPAPPKALGASPLLSSNGSVTRYDSHREDREWDAPQMNRPQIPAPRSSGFATHTNTVTSVVPPPIHHVPSTNRTVDRDGLLPPYQTTVQVTSFMPPPPPPRIMTLVQEEEGHRNSSSVFYHVLTRWYGRIVDIQDLWVSEENFCPPPNKERYGFEEWADRVSGWWYTHFEHLQKKQVRFPTIRRGIPSSASL